jgi:uncharacterized protein (TIGR00251 family)
MVQIRSHADGATVAVRAKPGAKKDAVLGERAGALLVSVTAPAQDGRANDAIVELLAARLGARRSQLDLVSGRTSRDKVILVRGATVEQLAAAVSGISPTT